MKTRICLVFRGVSLAKQGLYIQLFFQKIFRHCFSKSPWKRRRIAFEFVVLKEGEILLSSRLYLYLFVVILLLLWYMGNHILTLMMWSKTILAGLHQFVPSKNLGRSEFQITHDVINMFGRVGVWCVLCVWCGVGTVRAKVNSFFPSFL